MERKRNNLLKEYIKHSIRTILLEEKKKKDKKEQVKNLARIGLISVKFPKMKEVLVELMSPAFAYYIKNITVIAPKPTTFRIVLNNDLDFELTYLKRAFVAKISGKKYYLLNLGDSERAQQKIANLLSLSPQPKEVQKEQSDTATNQGLASDLGAMSGGGGGGGSLGGIGGGPGSSGNLPELQPEQIPTTDVPAPGEEVVPGEEEEPEIPEP